jgi:hypothetical protein
MTDTGMLVLQACGDSQKYVSGSYIETSPHDTDHSINIKVEISDVEEEEDPLSISLPGVEAEHEVSSFFSFPY